MAKEKKSEATKTEPTKEEQIALLELEIANTLYRSTGPPDFFKIASLEAQVDELRTSG